MAQSQGRALVSYGRVAVALRCIVMEQQNYSNHTRFVFLYHTVLLPVLTLTVGGAVLNLMQVPIEDHRRLLSASLILVLVLCAVLTTRYARVFSLKAQDRAIKAEENLRHFVLTGKLPDARIAVKQIVALRFASDAELADLARRAADENLSPDAIKRGIKNWRADHYRV